VRNILIAAGHSAPANALRYGDSIFDFIEHIYFDSDKETVFYRVVLSTAAQRDFGRYETLEQNAPRRYAHFRNDGCQRQTLLPLRPWDEDLTCFTYFILDSFWHSSLQHAFNAVLAVYTVTIYIYLWMALWTVDHCLQ